VTVSQITGSHGGIVLTSTSYANPITVTATGTVYGSAGISANSIWSIENYGIVAGTNRGDGIDLLLGGSVANEAGGTIRGYNIGLLIAGGRGTVENSGSISATKLVFADDVPIGVYLAGGGSITNASSGLIHDSVKIGGGAGTVENSGKIIDHYSFGIFLSEGGSVTNDAGGTINGGHAGVRIDGIFGRVENTGSINGYLGVDLGGVYGLVDNSGAITGRYGTGVFLADGGEVDNEAAGVILGGRFASNTNPGVQINGTNATVRNAGTIGGGKYAVYLGGTTSNHLVIVPGAVFSGGVAAHASATNTIELASSASAGILSGLGSAYLRFGEVTVDPGATWTLKGALTGFGGVTISGLNTSDSLDITDLAFASGEKASLGSTDQLTITNAGGTVLATIQLGADATGRSFALASDGQSGTDITMLPGDPHLISRITGSRGGILLSTATFANPLTVTSTGAVIHSGSHHLSAAVYAASAWVVANYGRIEGYGSNDDGVRLRAGGAVINGSTGTITGESDGIRMDSTGTVDNAGIIGGGHGINLAGGVVTNGASGVITGYYDAIVLTGSGTVDNAGSIAGYYTGVSLIDGGFVTNAAGATVYGVYGGVALRGSCTVENAGTIGAAGGHAAVQFYGTGANRLIIDGGAVFSGEVTANSAGANTIELAAKDGAGSLSGLGSQIQGFQTIVVDAGADWTISGSFGGTLDVFGTENGATIANGGAAVASSGGVVDGAIVQHGGLLVVASGRAEAVTVETRGNAWQLAGGMSGVTLSGGHLAVLGGKASAVEIGSGGVAFAGHGAAFGAGYIMSSLVHSGGVLVLGAQGNADDLTVESGGTLLQLGGSTSNVSLSGTQIVAGQLPGAPPVSSTTPVVASSTTVADHGQQIVNSNGQAFDTTVKSGGLVEVFAGGRTFSATVSSGGSLVVISGGAIRTTVLTGGNVYQFAGSSKHGTLSGGRFTVLGGEADAIVVEAGGFEFAGTFLNGSAGGTIASSVISSGGILATGVHGAVVSTVIDSGGTLFELAGVTSHVALSGGTQFVGGGLPGVPMPSPSPPATAAGTVVSSGGQEIVNANGSAVGTEVLSGGKIVFNGGMVDALSVARGGLIDLAKLAFSNAISLSFAENQAHTSGILTVSSGVETLKINLLGQYAAGGFHIAQDGGGGTAITYSGAAGSAMELTAGHA
jgi:autotransporter passenger strand-loop-strand repeat protein